MAYISEDIKRRIQSIKVEDVARELNLDVRKHWALCFMHDDHNPSLYFNQRKNKWHCFVCDKYGGPIGLVQEKLGYGYVDACKWLADRFGIIIPGDNGYRKKVKKKNQKIQPVIKNREKTDNILLDVEMLAWIVYNAKLSDNAKHFLYVERKYSPHVVKNLKIGSISNSDRLVNKLVTVFGRERALASGIVRENSRGLYLFFYTPCLVFPYLDAQGNIINIQTRYLGTYSKAPRFQFLPGSPTGMFNIPVLSDIDRKEPLYVAEGVTDCIAHLSIGHKAIAVPSATLLNPDEVKLIAPKNLFMYPDSNEAGENLFKKLSELLHDNYSSITRLSLPEGIKDYSDYYKILIEE